MVPVPKPHLIWPKWKFRLVNGTNRKERALPGYQPHLLAAVPNSGEPERGLNMVGVPGTPVGQHPLIIH
jgi:hypothetical protein